MKRYLWAAASLGIVCLYIWRARHLPFSLHFDLFSKAVIWLWLTVGGITNLSNEYKKPDRSRSWMVLYFGFILMWGTSLLDTVEKIWRIKA